MVRALLDGTKTQTRRMVKPQPDYVNSLGIAFWPDGKGPVDYRLCPYGQAGDRLWVRETTCIAPKLFAPPDDTCVKDYDGDLRYVSYKADSHSEDAMRDYKLKWTPAIHVPRWASRITLEITDVRVERLQDISETDAIAEGIFVGGKYSVEPPLSYPVATYKKLWESINGSGSWEANPFVWAITFKRVPL